MSGGFEVDLTSLARAADGVNGVIDDMQHSKVSGIGADYGNGDLAGVMGDFCSRWEIGVEHLTKDASEVASRLTQSAETYARAEHANVHMISGILQRGSGADPAASSW